MKAIDDLVEPKEYDLKLLATKFLKEVAINKIRASGGKERCVSAMTVVGNQGRVKRLLREFEKAGIATACKTEALIRWGSPVDGLKINPAFWHKVLSDYTVPEAPLAMGDLVYYPGGYAKTFSRVEDGSVTLSGSSFARAKDLPLVYLLKMTEDPKWFAALGSEQEGDIRYFPAMHVDKAIAYSYKKLVERFVQHSPVFIAKNLYGLEIDHIIPSRYEYLTVESEISLWDDSKVLANTVEVIQRYNERIALADAVSKDKNALGLEKDIDAIKYRLDEWLEVNAVSNVSSSDEALAELSTRRLRGDHLK